MAFREKRLLHFALIGGALWFLASRGERRAVALEPSRLAALHAAQASKLGVARLPDEGAREVDARAIEDEILYREALRMGLDRDDPIVKQRLVQKLLLLVEDLGGASRQPTEIDLRAHWAAHPERWRRPDKIRFVHVFASQLDKLPPPETIASAEAPPEAGEAFPYPRLATMSREDATRLFGASFADALAAGKTNEPMRSSFGWHRVRVLARIPAGPTPFAEAKSDVALDYLLERREAVVGAYLKSTVAAYDVRVGDRKVEGFVPTRRVAARFEGSAED
jgi:hypothetical protein